MVGRLYGGTDRMRDKYGDIVPGNFEMAVYAQNAMDQFTDPALSALNSEDAMERYQLQVMKTSTPETRLPPSEDRTTSGRKRAHALIARLFQGGPRGPTEQAYKPEMVQSNRSTYTYAVPSTDPVIASRSKNGTYHSDVNGNTVFRMSLPNNPSNKEIGTRMFNTQNRFAKYAAARSKRLENTSQIVDWVPQRKDRMWESRAIDEYRKRLMPRIEDIDNGDNVNRQKNTCRDTQKVAYRYRHKEYDTDQQLHEVLDNNTRVLPEITARQGDGTSIGELTAQLAKRGLADASTELDIYSSVKSARRNNNPNHKGAPHRAVSDGTLVHEDDKDGTHSIKRDKKHKSETTRVFEGLDLVKKEILMGDILDEIKQKTRKEVRPRRKDIKNKNSTFDNPINTDEDEDAIGNMQKPTVKYEDGDRDMMSFNIPILIDKFKEGIVIERSNPKMTKKSDKSKSKSHTVNDHEYYTSDDKDNDANRDPAMLHKLHNTTQNVRGLISSIMPELELDGSNSSRNPNVKVYTGVKNFALDAEPQDASIDSLGRAPISVEKALQRPKMPSGIVLDEQIEFNGVNKKMNQRRKKGTQVRDDDLY